MYIYIYIYPRVDRGVCGVWKGYGESTTAGSDTKQLSLDDHPTISVLQKRLRTASPQANHDSCRNQKVCTMCTYDPLVVAFDEKRVMLWRSFLKHVSTILMMTLPFYISLVERRPNMKLALVQWTFLLKRLRILRQEGNVFSVFYLETEQNSEAPSLRSKQN